MMAKMFYTADEAAERLQKDVEGLDDLVRQGTLREFRDAGKASYRVDDVEKLRGTIGVSDEKSSDSGLGASSSSSGEIVLESVEDSGVALSDSGSDVLSLEEVDVDDTSVGSAQKKKEDTVVPSVGINVFDDDELDEAVDPLAQTAVTDVAGMGIEGVGSGSGILDLTRESDDTSLGAELLEEIYTGEEEVGSDPADDTRAGFDEAIPEGEATAQEGLELEVQTQEVQAAPRVAATSELVVADPLTMALTALMVVAVLVLWVGGLAGAALVRGVAPSVISAIHSNLLIYAGGAVLIAVLASGLTYFLARRSG